MVQRAHSVPEAVPAASAAGETVAAPKRSAQKGQHTKQLIVDAALGLAGRIGLEGLSIGVVAELTRMSKSGVFAHFGSREELQISVVGEYYRRFEQDVFYAALQAPRGLPRVAALFRHWMLRVTEEIQSGCIFISGAVEFDDRPGPVRDALAGAVRAWMGALERALVLARDCGHLLAGVDERQMAFEVHALILAVHYEARFLNNPAALDRARCGFDSVLARYATPEAVAALRTETV